MQETTECLRFMELLWGGKDDDGFIQVWHLPTKRTAWFSDYTNAADEAARLEGDTYVGVALSPFDLGPSRRCEADKVIGIAGLWADIDYQSEAHKNTLLPPSEDDALLIVSETSLKPTVVVHSGHGIQAWWLFKEPLIFETDEDRKEAARYSARWQNYLRFLSKRKGWSIDSVHDLARLMRVPGTMNCKGEPVPARILADDGPRYVDWSDIETILPDEVQPEIDFATARGWDFWAETIDGVKEGDRNNRMASLAGKLLAGIDDLEDKDSVRLMRHFCLLANEKNQPPLPEKEVTETFTSIYRSELRRRMELEYETRFVDATEEIEAAEGEQEAMLSRIRRNLNGLPIRRIVKRMLENSEYTFELDDDRVIRLKNILNQNAVRKAIMDATGGDTAIIVPGMKQALWHSLCKLIAQVAIEEPIPDADRKEKLADWLELYLSNVEKYEGEAWKTGLVERSPFDKDGCLHINMQHFMHSLKANMIAADETTIRLGLSELGFRSKQVGATVDGKLYNRRYWVSTKHLKEHCN